MDDRDGFGPSIGADWAAGAGDGVDCLAGIDFGLLVAFSGATVICGLTRIGEPGPALFGAVAPWLAGAVAA